MPSLKTYLALALAVLALLGVLGLSGCGDKNSKSDYDPDTGRHPAGWLPFGHGQAAVQRLDTCQPCHGTDFTGGISKVACTQCHLALGFEGLPAGGFNSAGIGQAETDIHGPRGYYFHMVYVRHNGATGCATQFCHGANLQGGTGPSCSSCHLGGPFSVHPPEWRDQITLHGGYVLTNGAAACRNAVCHGAQLQGVFLSGPACNDCHNFSAAQLSSF